MTKQSPIWHPFTQHGLFPDSVAISHAEGASLFTQDDRRVIDAISSWWVNTHGHNHPKIVAAVQEQASKLDQVIFAGFTHEPAENLAQKLVKITAPELTRVFYSDSGSTAVEVALKMAVGAWSNSGKPRRKIIALEHAYHGDTFGAMSVGARSVYSKTYEPFLFDVIRLPFPGAGKEHLTIEALAREIAAHPNDIAAMIVEPLVLGAGGMLIYDAATLKAMHQLCKQHDIYFIADEVMTGWGRTGTLFACDQAGIVPDILCLSKGLSGGFLPLGATLCSEEIYSAFLSQDRAKMFFHSSSFTANPLACAAACASIDIWQTEPMQQRIDAVATYHTKALQRFSGRRDVANVRQCGTIAAIDFVVPDGGYLAALGPDLYRFFMARNVLLRPLGNVVYILPPYCISTADLEIVYDCIADALDSFGDGRKKQSA